MWNDRGGLQWEEKNYKNNGMISFSLCKKKNATAAMQEAKKQNIKMQLVQ